MPERVKELQILQAEQATQQAWWRSECSTVSLDGSCQRPSSSRGNPLLSQSPSCSNLQQELLEAMEAPLALDPANSFVAIPSEPLPAQALKTSDTHPIGLALLKKT